jgi:hypothetical protein
MKNIFEIEAHEEEPERGPGEVGDESEGGKADLKDVGIDDGGFDKKKSPKADKLEKAVNFKENMQYVSEIFLSELKIKVGKGTMAGTVGLAAGGLLGYGGLKLLKRHKNRKKMANVRSFIGKKNKKVSK